MNLQKPKRVTNRAYLRWVKTLDCCAPTLIDFVANNCVFPIDPHHSVPVSLGGSDWTAVPLCRHHHDLLQSSAAHRPKLLEISRELNIQFLGMNLKPRAKREQKPRVYQPRLYRRGYGIVLGQELQFPIVGSLREARELKRMKGGKIVRCPVRAEGVK